MIADNVGSFMRCRLQLETTEIGTLTNSEDQDEMLHNVVFHQDLHCFFLNKINLQRVKYKICLEIITCVPSINTMHCNYCDSVALREIVLV